MTDKMKSLVKGILAGLAGKPLEFAPGKEPVLHRSAGLYETGTDTMVYSWDQLLGDELLDGGVVHVTDGVMATNYYPGVIGVGEKNASAEIITGDLVLPKDGSITSIGESAFEKCDGLTYVQIPDGVTSIGTRAFRNCTQLAGVYIPESVEIIGDLWDGMGYDYNGAFYGCSALTSVRLPSRIGFIDSGIFHKCTGITSINIPDGVSVVGVSAFQECAGITSIVIPESVTEIMRVAFHGCFNLTRIEYNGTTAQWGAITLGAGWNEYVPATEIICTDGSVSL